MGRKSMQEARLEQRKNMKEPNDKEGKKKETN